MSIGPPIPEIQHFQSLTLKIQGQGHSSRSQRRYTTLSIHILLFHVNRPSHSWDTAMLKFDIENSRSRSWVRSKLKVTTWVKHSVDSHPFGSMSIGPPIPEIQHFQSLTLKIQGQGHSSQGWGQLHNINSNSNSRGFNSNSNSGQSPECQLQLQLRRFQLQLQFQLRRISRISTPTPTPTPEVSTPTPIPTPEI